VRERAEDGAAVVFEAQHNVVLDLVEAAGGWVHVRHRDGQAGYVKVNQVWGQ
jgi:SH3-like domain-containing protein